MQIRTKTHKIQLFRSEYVPVEYHDAEKTQQVKGTGRSKTKFFASFNMYEKDADDNKILVVDIPKKIAAVINEEEKAHLQNWLDDFWKDTIADSIKKDAVEFPSLVKRLVDNFETIKDDFDEEKADRVLQYIDEFRYKMKRAGYKLTRPTKQKNGETNEQGAKLPIK